MGWARGASFSLVSLTSFHRVNTVILSSLPLPLSLSDSPFPYPSPLSPSPSLSLSLSRFLFVSLSYTHLLIKPKHTWKRSGKFFLTNAYPAPSGCRASRCRMTLTAREKVAGWSRRLFVTSCLPGPSRSPLPRSWSRERLLHLFFFSPPAIQGSVALSQLKKRHEINVMSMAFFSWNPKALSQSHLAWCSHPLTVQWEWDGGCLSGNTVSMWCPLVAGRCIHSSAFRFFS